MSEEISAYDDGEEVALSFGPAIESEDDGEEIMLSWQDHLHPRDLMGRFRKKIHILSEGVVDAAFQDPAARVAIDALSQHGEMFVVGGAVRDIARGVQPKDIDIVARVHPDIIESSLEGLGRLDYTGKHFGVYRFRRDGSEVEIALPRTEFSTGEGHKDFDVTSDHTLEIAQDLARRDFTVNAMAVNVETGEVHDPFGGLSDLDNNALRTVSESSFKDDPLRIVRALVARSRFGLEPDDKTVQEMQRYSGQIETIAPDRLQAELMKMLAGQDPVAAVRLAHGIGVLKYFMPEMEKTFGWDQMNEHHEFDVGEHSLRVLEDVALQTPDPTVRLAALLHDVGKPDSMWVGPVDPDVPDGPVKGRFYKGPNGEGEDHWDLGAKIARGILARMNFPNEVRDRVEDLVFHHMFNSFDTPKGARRFLAKVGDVQTAYDLLKIRRADRLAKGEDAPFPGEVSVMKALLDAEIDAQSATSVRDLNINGRDIIESLGIEPGPLVGEILRGLLEAVLEDPAVNNRDDLLLIAQGLAMSEWQESLHPRGPGGKFRRKPTSLMRRLFKHKGFTFQPVSKNFPKSGFALSLFPEEEFKFSTFVSVAELGRKIEKYLDEHEDLLTDESLHFGAYKDIDTDGTEKWFFDVSQIVTDKTRAERLAKWNTQLAIYDLSSGNLITTLSPEERKRRERISTLQGLQASDQDDDLSAWHDEGAGQGRDPQGSSGRSRGESGGSRSAYGVDQQEIGLLDPTFERLHPRGRAGRFVRKFLPQGDLPGFSGLLPEDGFYSQKKKRVPLEPLGQEGGLLDRVLSIMYPGETPRWKPWPKVDLERYPDIVISEGDLPEVFSPLSNMAWLRNAVEVHSGTKLDVSDEYFEHAVRVFTGTDVDDELQDDWIDSLLRNHWPMIQSTWESEVVTPWVNSGAWKADENDPRRGVLINGGMQWWPARRDVLISGDDLVKLAEDIKKSKHYVGEWRGHSQQQDFLAQFENDDKLINYWVAGQTPYFDAEKDSFSPLNERSSFREGFHRFLPMGGSWTPIVDRNDDGSIREIRFVETTGQAKQGARHLALSVDSSSPLARWSKEDIEQNLQVVREVGSEILHDVLERIGGNDYTKELVETRQRSGQGLSGSMATLPSDRIEYDDPELSAIASFFLRELEGVREDPPEELDFVDWGVLRSRVNNEVAQAQRMLDGRRTQSLYPQWRPLGSDNFSPYVMTVLGISPREAMGILDAGGADADKMLFEMYARHYAQMFIRQRNLNERAKKRSEARAILAGLFAKRRAAIIEALSEIRPLGGAIPFENKTRKGNNKEAQEAATRTAQIWPSDWIDKLKPLDVKFTKNRGHYQHFGRAVRVSSSTRGYDNGPMALDGVAVHEVGHAMEYHVPGIVDLEAAYWQMRTEGEDSRSLQRLFPGHGYSSGEMTKEDEFLSAYMGKHYAGDAWEILTMGIQELWSGDSEYNLLVEDPDYAAFILGLLAVL